MSQLFEITDSLRNVYTFNFDKAIRRNEKRKKTNLGKQNKNVFIFFETNWAFVFTVSTFYKTVINKRKIEVST